MINKILYTIRENKNLYNLMNFFLMDTNKKKLYLKKLRIILNGLI
jgi:hypothetical protein